MRAAGVPCRWDRQWRLAIELLQYFVHDAESGTVGVGRVAFEAAIGPEERAPGAEAGLVRDLGGRQPGVAEKALGEIDLQPFEMLGQADAVTPAEAAAERGWREPDVLGELVDTGR